MWWPWAWYALAVSVAVPERAAAEPYTSLLRTAGGCVRMQVSRDAPPPLPGGYKVGEKVFFTGVSKTFDDGDKLVHGQQGEVTGHATAESHKGKGVHVLFPGNEGVANLLLTSVRRLRAASAATPAPACPAPQTHGAAHTPPSRATCVFPGALAAPQPQLQAY